MIRRSGRRRRTRCPRPDSSTAPRAGSRGWQHRCWLPSAQPRWHSNPRRAQLTPGAPGRSGRRCRAERRSASRPAKRSTRWPALPATRPPATGPARRVPAAGEVRLPAVEPRSRRRRRRARPAGRSHRQRPEVQLRHAGDDAAERPADRRRAHLRAELVGQQGRQHRRRARRRRTRRGREGRHQGRFADAAPDDGRRDCSTRARPRRPAPQVRRSA